MIRQNQTINASEVDMDEKLIQTPEAIIVEDGNGHEFSFADNQQNEQNMNENAEIPMQEFDFATWNNWVNGYLQYLDQQRLLLEEQLKAKDEIIEKLVLDLSKQEQKIISLVDEMASDRTEFASIVRDLQGQLTRMSEQMSSLFVKHSSPDKRYRFEDIPGFKNINPEVFRKECSYRKNTVSLVPFKDNVALMRTVFLIENQDNLTADEKNELKRLMLDF